MLYPIVQAYRSRTEALPSFWVRHYVGITNSHYIYISLYVSHYARITVGISQYISDDIFFQQNISRTIYFLYARSPICNRLTA